MNKIIAKISLICWGFIVVFSVCLVIAAAIPSDYVAFVSTTLGAFILTVFVFDLRKIARKEGLDFGWFLTVKKGFWRILLGLIGLILFSAGLFAVIFPTVATELGEIYGLKIASILVVMFWTALMTTFLGWELICLAESVAHLRNGNIKIGLGSFALGLLWLLFLLLFFSLFLEVINDIFFAISDTNKNRCLIIAAILSIGAGLLNGAFLDIKSFGDKEKISSAIQKK